MKNVSKNVARSYSMSDYVLNFLLFKVYDLVWAFLRCAWQDSNVTRFMGDSCPASHDFFCEGLHRERKRYPSNEYHVHGQHFLFVLVPMIT